MYISKKELTPGYHSYIDLDSPAGRLAMMDVGVVVLEAGESYTFGSAEKETAVVLVEGEAVFRWTGGTEAAKRPNCFDYRGWCLHLPKGERAVVEAAGHSELYVQAAVNEREFPAKMYRPEDVIVQRMGANGEVAGKIRRNVCTYFEYANAPYSNMVVGEVCNIPGLWSSYPPHYHPQPEVYYYRFDKPQGFGAGFANGQVYKTEDHGLLLITEGFHSQVTAPGYAMYYIWGIRHLDGNPWDRTRIDCEEHTWMLEKDCAIWSGDAL